jgi:hypothetical protein
MYYTTKCGINCVLEKLNPKYALEIISINHLLIEIMKNFLNYETSSSAKFIKILIAKH